MDTQPGASPTGAFKALALEYLGNAYSRQKRLLEIACLEGHDPAFLHLFVRSPATNGSMSSMSMLGESFQHPARRLTTCASADRRAKTLSPRYVRFGLG